MMTESWTGLPLGLAAAAGVAALARVGLRGGRATYAHTCHFLCPLSGDLADCEMVQDVRTGQWKEVRSCSLFPGAEALPCERDCAARLNLGLRLEGWRLVA